MKFSIIASVAAFVATVSAQGVSVIHPTLGVCIWTRIFHSIMLLRLNTLVIGCLDYWHHSIHHLVSAFTHPLWYFSANNACFLGLSPMPPRLLVSTWDKVVLPTWIVSTPSATPKWMPVLPSMTGTSRTIPLLVLTVSVKNDIDVVELDIG